jgi:hypothetical protein
VLDRAAKLVNCSLHAVGPDSDLVAARVDRKRVPHQAGISQRCTALIDRLRISAKMNGDSGIVNMDSGAVNSDSGQYERSGSEGLILRSIILGRGGFSAE